ncbi:hypothetical protein C2E23DRAFT_881421 [Lenzites betulinus]|nr:hypothetical protein C2E23DRAFT_881421 [Lenzites betulinus]
MRRVDPPYPSFALVLSTPQPRPRQPPPSRLPPYRAAHMGRYHPYARVSPGPCQDRLMNTVDYRFTEEPLWEDDGELQSATGSDDDDDTNDALPNHNAERERGDGHPPPEESKMELSRSKLVDTLTDVLMTLRRRYLTLQAVKSFLKAENVKLKGA